MSISKPCAGTESDPRLPPGTNFYRCGGCGQHFLNVRAFDVHRQGKTVDRSCTARPFMRDAGLERDARGYWRLPKREFVVDIEAAGA